MKVMNFVKKTLMLSVLLLMATTVMAQTASKKIYYVTPTGDAPTLTLTAEEQAANVTVWTADDTHEFATLVEALAAAKPGDEIWVQGFDEVYSKEHSYIAPKDGFKLKAGVQLYGGFRGTEKNINDREVEDNFVPYFRYRSMLSGDTSWDDELYVDPVNMGNKFFYPVNPTRKDNALHVVDIDLTSSEAHPNTNGIKTIIDGFTIVGGGSAFTAGADGKMPDESTYTTDGGGIYVHATSTASITGAYHINRCVMYNNYANRGGAIYVSREVTEVKDESLISFCEIFNNCSGQSYSMDNDGAVYIHGTGTMVNTLLYTNDGGGVVISNLARIVNSDIVRNATAGVDMAELESGRIVSPSSGSVFNTVVWGNFKLSSVSNSVNFFNCGLQDISTAGNPTEGSNIALSEANKTLVEGENPPYFNMPPTTSTFDQSFSWKTEKYPHWEFDLMYQSALIDGGSHDHYKEDIYGDVCIYGNRATGKTGVIDIGAMEYQHPEDARVLYVVPGGAGDKTGKDWANAMSDPQAAIDALAETPNQIGEVWVAAGVYTPQMVEDGKLYTASFRMKDGISVYGGFEGDETRKRDREIGPSGKSWDFVHQTIFQGSNYGDEVRWNDVDVRWITNSESFHVVYLAPMEGEKPFTYVTILDGVTVQGGSATATNGLSDFKTDRGAGVYAEYNGHIRNCIIRRNYASSNGGGVYLKNAYLSNSLVYNNSADKNGGGIYVEETGYITHVASMNNAATNGAGVYMHGSDNPAINPSYLIVNASVISNNTSRANGAVYLDRGGVIQQVTITNNNVRRTTDVSDAEATYTSGLYIKGYGVAINSILWNNGLYNDKYNAEQVYVYSGSDYPAKVENIRFYNNAINNPQEVTWNNTYQTGTILLNNENICTDQRAEHFHPYFATGGKVMTSDQLIQENQGVLATVWNNNAEDIEVDYFWKPVNGTALASHGEYYGNIPATYLFIRPDFDLDGVHFNTDPAVGAYQVPGAILHPQVDVNSGGTAGYVRLYVDPNAVDPTAEASSWDRAIFSLAYAMKYMSELEVGGTIATAHRGTTDVTNITVGENTKLEIFVREGELSASHKLVTDDPNSASIIIPVMKSDKMLYLYGGFNPEDDDANSIAQRSPTKYRTVADANPKGLPAKDANYHSIYVEAGAKVHIDGFYITGGYATGARDNSISTGAGIEAVDAKEVEVYNTIIEDNYAIQNAAIDARGAKLTLVNTVINNNTTTRLTEGGTEGTILRAGTLSMNHTTIVNNIGKAPANTGNLYATSFAAGNYNVSADGALTPGAKYDDINVGTAAAADPQFTFSKDNFSNPTSAAGASETNITYFGGYSEFRPLTNISAKTIAIINQAAAVNTAAGDLAYDITISNERDLGGVPDLGAYEADLPRKGKIIYVRSYNTDWDGDREESNGSPSTDLLTTTNKIYDGSSWDNAIMGNIMCDNTVARNANDFYVSNGTLLSNKTSYGTGQYAPSSGHYGAFYNLTGNAQANENFRTSTVLSENTTENTTTDRNYTYESGYYVKNEVTTITTTQTLSCDYKINNTRDERYISGLQYAIERAAECNAIKADSVVVWVGSGIYTDWKGYVIRNGVKVYGGFSNVGTPSEDDRHPLLSDYVPAAESDAELTKSQFETILQIDATNPVSWEGHGSTLQPTAHITSNVKERHYVLFQPDVCLPTKSPYYNDVEYRRTGATKTTTVTKTVKKYYTRTSSGWGGYNYTLDHTEDLGEETEEGDITYNGDSNHSDTYRFESDPLYQDYANVVWDGFTVRHGYIYNYHANRDGGPGIRVFRGVNLHNMIVVNNYNYSNTRNRGGGMYMDGLNTTISNSFILNNYGAGNQSYGGGAYMIVGTGYNMVVANNYSTTWGGGLFIESATFYNNTVAYNYCLGHGTGIFQYADGASRLSKLGLFNCIFYGNAGSEGTQIYSNTPGTFEPAYHCYVNGGVIDELTNQFAIDPPYNNQISSSLANPFSYGSEAAVFNNYRLNPAVTCLNRGTDVLGTDNYGKLIVLPASDMDYTPRIKDCRVDIGAYELDPDDNVKATETGNLLTYYVNADGYGLRHGDDAANAACATKLQAILDHAGQMVAADATGQKRAVVKVAGYVQETKPFTYTVNTLSDPDFAQSYSFVVPDGVTLEGGYYEGTVNSNGVYQNNGWDSATGDNVRNAVKFKTVLSAKTMVDEQVVQGYHVVTFGSHPGNETLVKGAMIDGVTLQDGKATIDGGAGGTHAIGGGAIVPKGAVVKNCVVGADPNIDITGGNEALQGGGLYVLPGGEVIGTLVYGNKAKNGAGIYTAATDAEGTAVTADTRVHIYSSTITKNTATNSGGGLYHEAASAMVTNSVVWANEASTDKNVSVAATTKLDDTELAKVFGTVVEGEGTAQTYYPYNNCFVETYEMPTDFYNTEMVGDDSKYFTAEVEYGNSASYYRPHTYSALIKRGLETKYQTELEDEVWNEDEYDMANVARNYTSDYQHNVTAGAFAYQGAAMPTALFTRIFVAKSGREVTDIPQNQSETDLMGRSFATPMLSLDEALEYIRMQRSNGNATTETHFEILIAEGVYKPGIRRGDNTATEVDQRLSSFSIPQNVSIYGGFAGDEPYSSSYANGASGVVKFTNNAGTVVTTKDNGDIMEILKNRAVSDFNVNTLYEPWELAHQVVLSGNMNNTVADGKVYHVVYSEPASGETVQGGVILDGVTLLDGMSATTTSPTLNEQGRGAGVYSDKIPYTVVRSRIISTQAIEGAGMYVRDANVIVVGSMMADNLAKNGTAKGGALMLDRSTTGTAPKLRTANSLWVNNEAANGAAIALGGTASVDMMSNTIVHNKAAVNPVVDMSDADLATRLAITNTVMWGNDGTENIILHTKVGNITYSASDVDGFANVDTSVSTGTSSSTDKDKVEVVHRRDTDNNIQLDKTNMTQYGPRFATPSSVRGVGADIYTMSWEPAALSILTDNGAGDVLVNVESDATDDELGHATYNSNGTVATMVTNDPKDRIYTEWWNSLTVHGYEIAGYTIDPGVDMYITTGDNYLADVDPATTRAYFRFRGPRSDDGSLVERPIDIGMYEFQYKLDMSMMEKVYVSVTGSGDMSGTSWDNATPDLRGAIVALSHPTGNITTGLPSPKREIYVKSGEYFSPTYFAGNTAFSLQTQSTALLESLTIYGSCIGIGAQQDFSKPTVLVPNPTTTTTTMMAISAGKPVTISGFTFQNPEGKGIAASTKNDKNLDDNLGSVTDWTPEATSVGKITIANSAFCYSGDNAFEIDNTGNGTTTLIYNTLFADNEAVSLVDKSAANSTTVVNATFANNGTDYTGNVTLYNTVAWENATQNLTAYAAANGDNKNVAFAAGTANNDVLNGPNFVNPDAGDYRLRPSVKLLNKGSNELYVRHAMENATQAAGNDNFVSFINTEVDADPKEGSIIYKPYHYDLKSSKRVTDNMIDVGAYEFDTELRPIIYVKSGLIESDESGRSWEHAASDFQAAVDLAGIYSNSHNNAPSYVFVHNNVTQDEALNVTLPYTKVYGGMNDETATKSLGADQFGNTTLVKAIVDELLGKRKGLIEATERTDINGVLTIKNATNAGDPSVVDGFYVNNKVVLGNGMLSTSIVTGELVTDGSALVTGQKNSWLYNTLVNGNVEGVGRVINVTATGTIAAVDGGTHVNNIQNAGTIDTKLIAADKGYWRYQLADNSPYIDATGNNNGQTVACIDMVGHNRDIAGNVRLRNTVAGYVYTGQVVDGRLVDNGCFETWNVTEASTVNADDYPHGYSVVYVNDGKELTLGKAVDANAADYADAAAMYGSTSNAFSPGFLLLKHQAGLRGNGNYVTLNNYAVERDIPNGGDDFVVLPYEVDANRSSLGYLRPQAYDGNQRSLFTYKFDTANDMTYGSQTGAWTYGNFGGVTEANMTIYTNGLYYNNNSGQDVTMRFYNNLTNGVYREVANEDKNVILTQYNHSMNWSSPEEVSDRFTHKENMGWNLFGSPFLCALDYEDMEYARVMYGLQKSTADGATTYGYVTIGSETDATLPANGYIPSGDAVFTQTATLRSHEFMKVKQPMARTGEMVAYASGGVMKVALTGEAKASRTATAEAEVMTMTDELHINTVAAESARTDFDVTADGVKWMMAGAPQLYADINGGRYSLLSAVNEEGKLPVSLSLPMAGMYTLSVPMDVDDTNYEAVMLADAKTGKKVNLLEENYQFAVVEPGEVKGRFALSFKLGDNTLGGSAIKVWSDAPHSLRITGVESDDHIAVYTADGVLVTTTIADGNSARLNVNATGVILVKVTRADAQIAVRKTVIQ